MAKSSPKKVEARLLKGFQDYLPGDLLPRLPLIRRIEEIFVRYGFSPIETPILEHLDVLLGAGGENANKELFRLETPEEEEVGMRFDLTVPFSRVVAQYPDKIKTPFRRYAIGPVFRADKPGPGRFRQFTQLDADIAGSPVIGTDAEMIAIMAEVMKAAGVDEFNVLINNRKLIDALLEGNGISKLETQKHVLRVIDKLAKVGIDNIRRELGPGRIDDSGDPIPGVELDEAVIEKILEFVAIEGDNRRVIVDNVEKSLGDAKGADTAITEMRDLADALEALGVDEAHAKFDPSLARGLDYYTGPVFEIVLPQAPQFGSVGGGGRYDGLVSRFSSQPMPCTGMSIGLDRLVAALTHLGLVEEKTASAQVLVVTLGAVPQAEVLGVARELRDAGIATEVFMASKKKMKMGTQLSHADHYGIPVAVILGEDEVANGQVSVKDLVKGKEDREDIDDRDEYRAAGKTGQETVSRADLLATVQSLLARG